MCCVRIQLPLTRAKHGPLQATKERPLLLANQPQTRLAGVAEPSENASRIIAIVQLDNGFSLMLGLLASDRKFRKLLRESIDEFLGVQGGYIQSPVYSF